MEVEILKEALDLARVKKPTLLSRSQLPEDTRHRDKPSTLLQGTRYGAGNL
jgi:hypothetical protein